jgi:UDP:flavonoid glycosyltransferase YjiC (YdhE family)
MRVVIAVLGSLGDLHPLLALAAELKSRGHAVCVATHQKHGSLVEHAGFPFRPLRPDVDAGNPAYRDASTFDAFCRAYAKAIPGMFEDLSAHARDAELLVSTELVSAARLVAAVDRIPWASCALAPHAFATFREAREDDTGRVLLKETTRALAALCSAKNIPPERLFHRPELTCALFSPLLLDGPIPEGVEVAGFPRYRSPPQGLPDSLLRFIRSGEPPIVFTLGTTVVGFGAAAHLCDTMMAAARQLDQRLILALSDRLRDHVLRGPTDDSVFVAGFVDYPALFRHARIVVHHGGIGTTGHVLHAGVPMLVIPHIVDQHYNADAVRRLGLARVLAEDCTRERAVAELTMLLTEESYRVRAEQVAEAIQNEDGAVAGCDVIERRFGQHAASAGIE